MEVSGTDPTPFPLTRRETPAHRLPLPAGISVGALRAEILPAKTHMTVPTSNPTTLIATLSQRS